MTSRKNKSEADVDKGRCTYGSIVFNSLNVKLGPGSLARDNDGCVSGYNQFKYLTKHTHPKKTQCSPKYLEDIRVCLRE